MRSGWGNLLFFVLIASLARCGDAPTQPRTLDLTPTPIPAPLDLNGEWTGTLTYSEGAADPRCPTREEIQIVLGHGNGAVSGSMRTFCWGTLELRGRIPGVSIFGITVELWGNDQFIARLHGDASSTRINVRSHGASPYRGGPIELDLSRPQVARPAAERKGEL